MLAAHPEPIVPGTFISTVMANAAAPERGAQDMAQRESAVRVFGRIVAGQK